MKKLKLSKTLKDNILTYGMVILAYIIMQILIGTGNVSSLMQGLLVPLCVYVILAVSLNLTVGILGVKLNRKLYTHRVGKRLLLQLFALL